MTRSPRVRPSTFCAVAGLIAGLLVIPSLAAAQPGPSWVDPAADDTLRDWSDEVPAHIAVVDGAAWLHRDGLNEAAAESTPLLAGDRLRTGAGRLEVLFADGSVLAFDEHTDAELLSDTLLRLDRGRIRLELARTSGVAGYRIDAAGTTTWIRAAGEYRLDVDDRNRAAPDVRLLVIRGLAELSSADGARTLVRAGYEASANARSAPSLPYAVAVSSWDTFDRWWEARREERTGFTTTRNLPAEIAYYGGVLDRHGDWQYEPVHGHVWYPRVDHGWHPYSVGRWSFVGNYGWVWIGAHRWAWPTHHYGRWGVSSRGYYWIPGRLWAPAWVSWASAPGYVGWSPLGFDNRPLLAVSLGHSRGWHGWTYVPSHSFNVHVVVANRGRHVPPHNVHITSGYRGPVKPAGVVVRNTSGLRGPAAAARVAVPRVSTSSVSAGVPTATRPGRGGVGPSRSAPAADGRVETPRRGLPAAQQAQPSRSRTVSPTRSAPSSAPEDSDRREPAVRAPSSVGAQPRRSTQTPTVAPVRPPESTSVDRSVPAARSRVQRRPTPAPVPPEGNFRTGAPPATRERTTRGEPAFGRETRTMPAAPSPERPAAVPPSRVERTPAAPAAPVVRQRTAPEPAGRAPAERQERTSPAPSRAPRAEAQRPAERPAPSSPSNGERGTARARGR